MTRDNSERFRRFCRATAFGSPQPISQIIFEETENGRPYFADLSGIRFSFSSCRFGFLGAWSSTHWIGVDLEDQTMNLEAVELARHYFSESEADAIKKGRRFSALAGFIPFLESKESGVKIHWRRIAFWLGRLRIYIGPMAASC